MAKSRRPLLLIGMVIAVLGLMVPLVVLANRASAAPVIGAIAEEWDRVRSVVGEALEPEFCGLRDDGCAQRFERGSIYWTPGTGAQHMRGAIRDVWGANGWENGLSGYPTSGEFCGLRDGGCGQRFQNGTIHFNPTLGTYRIFGAISEGWAQLGWEAGPVGYPAAGEACGLRGDGCFQRFENGFIYWSPASGPHATVGRILDYWGETGWEDGRFGYPTSNEACRDEAGARICDQDFQGGRITWRSDRGIEAPRGVDCNVAKCIALTYDDGPVRNTERLLDTLERESAKATFFMVGTNVSANPATVRRMRDSGMELANHTINHPDLTGQGYSGTTSQLRGTNDRIRAASGVTPTWMRPPYGARNSTVDRAAGDLGLGVVLWSVDTNDWRDRNSSVVTQRVLSNAQPGAIVLMHDIHGTTVEAAPAIIRGLKDQGYTMVTLTELLGPADPGRVYISR